ncbi:hypothetical protein C8J57DRAFT_1227657 [Mycena rebaudengoi]|nr:hypothetical protein C8J57DRAFT_1227657 [Mycena rebaudengoi]
MPSADSLSARSSSPDAPSVTPNINGNDNASVTETDNGGAFPLPSTPWIAILRDMDRLLLDPVEALHTLEFGDLFQYLIDPSLLDEATKMDKLWYNNYGPENAPDWVRAAFRHVPEVGKKIQPSLKKAWNIPPPASIRRRGNSSNGNHSPRHICSLPTITSSAGSSSEEEQGDNAEETDAHVAGDSDVDEEPPTKRARLGLRALPSRQATPGPSHVKGNMGKGKGKAKSQSSPTVPAKRKRSRKADEEGQVDNRSNLSVSPLLFRSPS